jgi:hypothetical protein
MVYSETSIHHFHQGSRKITMDRESDRCRALYKIGFFPGQQKLNDGSGKTVYLRMID